MMGRQIFIENLASGPYYTEAVKALRANKQACTLLGEPIRFQTLRLGDRENVVTTQHAQVSQRLVDLHDMTC